MPITRESAVSRRAFEKIYEDENGCWQWTGGKKAAGYGQMLVIAHRFFYELLVGPIPDGMHLDHFVCDDPSCVNPAHLKITTLQENVRRDPKTHGRETACPKGHPYDEENTYVYTDSRGYPHRLCRTCRREKNYARQLARAKKRGGEGYPTREP